MFKLLRHLTFASCASFQSLLQFAIPHTRLGSKSIPSLDIPAQPPFTTIHISYQRHLTLLRLPLLKVPPVKSYPTQRDERLPLDHSTSPFESYHEDLLILQPCALHYTLAYSGDNQAPILARGQGIVVERVPLLHTTYSLMAPRDHNLAERLSADVECHNPSLECQLLAL